MRLRGRFVAQTPALRFRFLGLTARTGNETLALTGADVRTFVEAAANAALPEAVAQVVTAPGSSTPLFLRCGGTADPLIDCARRFNASLPDFVPGLPAGVFSPANVACVPDPRPGFSGTACAFIPNVYRVNHRPEGVEVVVSEGEAGDQFIPYLDDPDVFYPLLELGGACTGEGSNVVGRAPVGGYMGTVFEIPPPGPRPFGDE